MTNTTQPADATANSKSPSHVAYRVQERNGNSYWTKIGSVWQHADKSGFNVQLECVPLDGRVTLRVITEKKD